MQQWNNRRKKKQKKKKTKKLAWYIGLDAPQISKMKKLC